MKNRYLSTLFDNFEITDNSVIADNFNFRTCFVIRYFRNS